ncbi:hypothetical protein ACN9MF_17965 [Methylobacterium fujisawaense]|uniref:hypothetical protein n=1 Tax=Methylobacterium fujisawaense TaxID=107400 RepID=UPI003CF1D62B
MSKDKGKRKGILPLMNEAWLDRLEEMKAINDAQMKEAASKPSNVGSEMFHEGAQQAWQSH